MPLHPGKSREIFSRNVSEMVHAGHPLKQALAAAYNEKRHSYSLGGATELGPPVISSNARRAQRERANEMTDIARPPQDAGTGKPELALGGAPAPWQVRAEARGMMHQGPIVSAVPGRTDRHNMSVASGSYVVPAQAVSHLGQSNSLAGFKVLNGMFGQGGPYGVGGGKIAHGPGAPRPPKAMAPLASGGATDQGGARGSDDTPGAPVDVVTAGGEYVIGPQQVAAVGGGDLRHGHNVLDAWVNSILDDHIKTLKKLPPPAKT